MRIADLLAFFLVGLIGFAAHRASLCSVKAVAEVMTSRTAHMLASLLKATAWTILVSGLLVLATGGTGARVLIGHPLAVALLGGLVFGIGAAINGGCSLSTLQHLADGRLSMLGTLAGFVGGLALGSGWTTHLEAPPTSALAAPWLGRPVIAALVLVPVGLWAVVEIGRLLRRAPGEKLLGRLVAPAYRLSSAAALLGIAGGVLFTVEGAWTYSNYLRTATAHWQGDGPGPTGPHALFLLALVIGMALSSVSRGSFALHRGGIDAWLRGAFGGLVMGLGAALVPGGNDTMLLALMPTLMPGAFVTFLAMLGGIALALAAMAAWTGGMPAVVCSDDHCIGP